MDENKISNMLKTYSEKYVQAQRKCWDDEEK